MPILFSVSNRSLSMNTSKRFEIFENLAKVPEKIARKICGELAVCSIVQKCFFLHSR